MLNRRAFIHTAALAWPLAGCAAKQEAPPAAASGAAIGNLTEQQMDAAARDAAQFENVLQVVRKADVPYAVEPRFFPSV